MRCEKRGRSLIPDAMCGGKWKNSDQQVFCMQQGRPLLQTPSLFLMQCDYLLPVLVLPPCCSSSATCAAASLAVNNRKGEQDT